MIDLLSTVATKLTTSDALKATMSDLDNMFDSEDDEERSSAAASAQLLNGHANNTQSTTPSGGASLASAQNVGPISTLLLVFATTLVANWLALTRSLLFLQVPQTCRRYTRHLRHMTTTTRPCRLVRCIITCHLCLPSPSLQ